MVLSFSVNAYAIEKIGPFETSHFKLQPTDALIVFTEHTCTLDTDYPADKYGVPLLRDGSCLANIGDKPVYSCISCAAKYMFLGKVFAFDYGGISLYDLDMDGTLDAIRIPPTKPAEFHDDGSITVYPLYFTLEKEGNPYYKEELKLWKFYQEVLNLVYEYYVTKEELQACKAL